MHPDTGVEKITIIEGPPPLFESSPETWSPSVADSATMPHLALCRLRTFNGAALVERCVKAWRASQPIHLEYRASDGLKREAQIVAARNVRVNEGDLLLLWVRIFNEDVEYSFEADEDDEDDDWSGLADEN